MIQKVHDDSSEWYNLGRTFSHVEGISVVAVQLCCKVNGVFHVSSS